MGKEKFAIKIDNLSKEYRLYDKPIYRIVETFLPSGKIYYQSFRALDNVSLEIKRGETIGIVGRNGSGKSTLLQIICGIIKPTEGSVVVDGRISALLELGAGFNPEFTGRQNVYLNGSILGLTQEEIDNRLDDILSFADIGDFVDQPVKSYSSGMFVRLAFAVAISIEPEILIVDEALSVGDEAFQRKCFSKINNIQKNGGTILFVSHSTTSIVELCTRAFMFDNGELLVAGEPKQVVSRYQKMIYASEEGIIEMKKCMRSHHDRFNLVKGEEDLDKNEDEEYNKDCLDCLLEPSEKNNEYDPNLIPVSTVRYERKGARITQAGIANFEGSPVNILKSGETYYYHYRIEFEVSALSIRLGMLIKTIKGVELSGYSAALGGNMVLVKAGSQCRVEFPFTCMLNPGVYFLNAGIIGMIDGEEVFLDRQLDVAMFRVEEKRDRASTGIVDMVGTPKIQFV